VVGVVEGYVGELGRALVGPRRRKDDLLTEARDGLTDAAEAYQRGGLAEPAAQARAVADFGPVAEVAPGFQRELAATQGRRTALLICLILAPQHLVWAASGHAAVRDPAWRPGPGYAAMSSLVEVSGAITLGVALLMLVALARFSALARIAGWFAVAVAALFTGVGLALTLLGPVPPLMLTGLPWTIAFLVAPMAALGWSARRTLAAAAPSRSPAATRG
jgi:hypothetical protein